MLLVVPSNPTEHRLGTDGVEEGVPESVTFPQGVCIPPELEFLRDPLLPGTEGPTIWDLCENEDPCFTGDSEIAEWCEARGKVLEPFCCTRGERPTNKRTRHVMILWKS